MIWGAISLLFVIIFYATLAFQLSHRNAKVDEKDDQDVYFVTEYFGLHHHEPVKLEHSYKSTGSWAGDYMKIFAIKIAHIEESEIGQMQGWVRGDKLLPTIRGSVKFITNFTDRDELRWFPTSEQIFSSAYYVYPVRMVLYGTQPDSVRIMVVRPSDKMVFFAALKI